MINRTSRRGTRVAGVDPGKTGAVVVLDGARLIAQTRMPLVRGTRDLDHRALYAFFREHKPDVVVQEFVRSRPENGVKQAFEFGRTCEACRCIAGVLGLPFLEVTPKAWQSIVVGLDHGDVKTSVVRAARAVWPALSLDLKVDWGKADAAFVALYHAKKNETLVRAVPHQQPAITS